MSRSGESSVPNVFLFALVAMNVASLGLSCVALWRSTHPPLVGTAYSASRALNSVADVPTGAFASSSPGGAASSPAPAAAALPSTYQYTDKQTHQLAKANVYDPTPDVERLIEITQLEPAQARAIRQLLMKRRLKENELARRMVSDGAWSYEELVATRQHFWAVAMQVLKMDQYQRLPKDFAQK